MSIVIHTTSIDVTTTQTLQSDQLEKKHNETYASVASGATIETEDNVCYGQSISHIHTDVCVAYVTVDQQ